VAVLALVGELLISAGSVIAAPASPPGQTLLVADNADDTESGGTVLSDDGLTAAYQTRSVGFDDDGAYQVFTRTLPGGVPVRASTPTLPFFADATAPTISAAGDRVGYAVEYGFTREKDPAFYHNVGDNQLFVGRTPITGTTRDLTWQRTEPCNPLFANATTGYCGPRLSGDGRTVAFPAFDSITSPYVVPGQLAGEENTFSPSTDINRNYLPMFDFGFGSGDILRQLTVHIFGPDVDFGSGLPTSSDPDHFEVVPNNTTEDGTPDCRGKFDPGTDCDITVIYHPVRCGTVTTSFATLQTNNATGTTPAARTALSLVGTGCHSVIALRSTDTTTDTSTEAITAAAPCSTLPSPQALPSQFEEHPSAPVGVYGEQPLHTAQLRSWVVTNGSSEQNATVSFESPGCALTLDQSVPDQSADEPTCRQFTGGEISAPGSILGPGRSCVAYVRFEPQDVAAYAASLTLNTNAQRQSYRFSGSGGDRVVLARQDTAGDGTFAGAPIVVSAGDTGTAAVNGTEPAVSADGNLIAFSSTCAPDAQALPITDVACGSGSIPARHVYLRDLTAKTTRLVSLLPDGQPAGDAFEPSLSGDGGRLAFATLRHTLSPAGGPVTRTDQVYVRDLPAGRTVIASATQGGAATPGSSEPSLSRDGSTVGYSSTAPDLVDPPLSAGGNRVYVRDLGPDFGGPGAPANEEISIGSINGDPVDGGQSGMPSVNSDGGMIGFTSANQLTEAPVVEGEGRVTAYARARFGNAEVNPTSLTYPTTPVGSTSGPRTVTISNGGPGPLRVGTAVVGPYRVDGQPCPLLHRAESCTVGVTAVPTEPGPQPGTLTIPNNSDLGPASTVRVPLSGRAISPLIRVTPARTPFPTQLIGTTSGPIVVTVTNVSPVPLTITAGYEPATPHFTVRASTCTGVLAPAASCTVTTVYAPRSVGGHAGTLSLSVRNDVHEVAFTQTVPATGSTPRPAITVNPAVVTSGQVAQVDGVNFQPGRPVTITWSPGIGEATVTPDAAGRFSTQLITIQGDLLGNRDPVANATGIPTVKGPAALLVPGSTQPPDFGSRH
jgi:hypothetical protein